MIIGDVFVWHFVLKVAHKNIPQFDTPFAEHPVYTI